MFFSSSYRFTKIHAQLHSELSNNNPGYTQPVYYDTKLPGYISLRVVKYYNVFTAFFIACCSSAFKPFSTAVIFTASYKFMFTPLLTAGLLHMQYLDDEIGGHKHIQQENTYVQHQYTIGITLAWFLNIFVLLRHCSVFKMILDGHKKFDMTRAPLAVSSLATVSFILPTIFRRSAVLQNFQYKFREWQAMEQDMSNTPSI